MRYFRGKEFECKCGCGENNMAYETLEMLDSARAYADIPFVITSGYRCKKHNKAVGGKNDSAHLSGKAVDISAPDSRTRFWVVYGLIQAEFTRIGIATTFVHADTDNEKDKEVLFLY